MVAAKGDRKAKTNPYGLGTNQSRIRPSPGCRAGAEFGGPSTRPGAPPSLLDGGSAQRVLWEELGYPAYQGPSAQGTQAEARHSGLKCSDNVDY